MSITVGITHHTEYTYDRPVSMSPHIFRLRPAPHCRTPIKSYSLKVLPEDHFINWQQDPFGNYLARVVFPEKTTHFSFTVDLLAEMTVINPFDFFLEKSAETFPFDYEESLKRDLMPFLSLQSAGTSEAFSRLVDQVKPAGDVPTVDFLVSVNQAVNAVVEYCIRLEPGVQTPDETLEKASGSCRDSAWLLIQVLRQLGLAARFVSGYLVQLAPDQESLDGPSGPEEDFTDLHAWAEVFIPGAGWIGLDPTSGLLAGEGHIPLACTPDPASAAPVTGALDPCESEFSYFNKVTRVHEMPRVTKPYSDQQWGQMNHLGLMVDKQLADLGFTLTMGGEPTFISIDDMESAQWNTAADGPEKRRLAHNLFVAMQKEFAPGAFRHYGQGKWYPGEPLPRWAYSCYWRKDGVPLWNDERWLADINTQGRATTADLENFCKQLVSAMGLPADVLTTAYEDVLYHLWQEGSLPEDPDVDAPELLDAMTRKGFLQKLQNGLDQPVGFVLPIEWNSINGNWNSCVWQFRRKQCYLLPGDSPIGYRLPLASLGGATEFIERDPFSIPEHFAGVAEQARGHVVSWTIKTAMAFEVQNGHISVFMPPVSHFEQYMGLLSLLEAVAAHTQLTVVVEGYTPPFDSRVEKFAVTPDPGVIEVNIHPSNNWSELVERTTVLYELARKERLGTDKFMLDGRHTGTGGGNHVTMGGPTPAQSPFLQRPDLLRSFITYWQHHPGLSYLFSGLFIGPTSQAPRVDEARDELLYELEIAFSQMPTGDVQQPWLVDRLLRNLLVDLTGNTHRAEFCIDKLYSPDSASGRLGIVEFRGFEMPPHSRMSLLQMLLLRSLLAWFAKEPYHKPLVRWGTELHDKFLLPHYVKQDLMTVCSDLQAAGFDFQLSWLDPYFEFRFSRCGLYELQDVTMELRTAIEPWHVMGEEATGSGTARFVDSSLERVELKVKGLNSERYVVTCNGRRLPLSKTATRGEFVAGIRFRAWQPPSALHPTIGVHAPLVFDLYDTVAGRSLGGFTYHISHPGGRNFATFPINAFEAEGRRLARFWQHGHTPGVVADPNGEITTRTERSVSAHRGDRDFVLPPDEAVNHEYPTTLDLRRAPRFVQSAG